MRAMPSPSHNTRGIYAIITTFLLIMVILFAVLGFLYIGNMVKVRRSSLNEELVRYDYMMDIKNRLLSEDCYGQVIWETGGKHLDASQICPFPSGIIKGYTIEIIGYPNCPAQVWEHRFEAGDGPRQPYFVPVMAAGGRVCPGRVTVLL
jgi:hypothetical protein